MKLARTTKIVELAAVSVETIAIEYQNYRQRRKLVKSFEHISDTLIVVVVMVSVNEIQWSL